MSISRKITFFTVLFFLIAGGSSLGLELIYPEDGTYVVRSNYLIIKGGTPALEGLVVEINGLRSGVLDISSPEYKSVFADFLILEPELLPGKNKIKLEGVAGGKTVSTVTADVFFMENQMAAKPSGYRPYVMHTAQKEALCAPCHNMQPDAEQLKDPSAEGNPCASCHKGMLNNKYVHGPAGVFSCTYCHDPGAKSIKYKSREGDAALCNECHLDKVSEFQSNKYIHGPVAVGMCSACHDAHATGNPAQLYRPINEVCLACHEGLPVAVHFTQGIGKGHPVGGVSDPSSNGKELSCASCHNPHGGMGKNFFEREISSTMMLCGNCHKK